MSPDLRSLFLLFFLTFCSLSVFAQTLEFENYTIRDGLPSTWTQALYQDPQGLLWIGTDDGIASFDGQQFTSYGTREGLSIGFVICFKESQIHPGRLYIGTHGRGIDILEDGQFRNVKISPGGYQPNVVMGIEEDVNGVLWCRTADGIYKVKGDSVELLAREDHNQSGRTLFQTADRRMWLAFTNRIDIYEPGTSSVKTVPIDTAYGQIISNISNLEEVIWLGTTKGYLLELRNDAIVNAFKVSEHWLRDGVYDNAGYFWFATWKGILKIERDGLPNGEIAELGLNNGLTDIDLVATLIDREGNLWFAGRRKGLTKLSKRNIYNFSRQQTRLPGMAAASELNQHLFVSSADGLYEIWQNRDGSWQQHFHRLSFIKEGNLFGVFVDGNGLLWLVAGSEGLFGYEVVNRDDQPSRLRLKHALKQELKLENTRFLKAYMDHKYHLWLSIRRRTTSVYKSTGEVVQVDLNKARVIRHYTESDGLPASRITALTRDYKNRMWFCGFRGGIAVFAPDGDQFTLEKTIDENDSLTGTDFVTIYPRRNGEMWIATRFNGLSVYKNGEIRSLTREDGLYTNTVSAMAEDPSGRMWLATPGGVLSSDRANSFRLNSHKYLENSHFDFIGFVSGKQVFYGTSWNEFVVYEYGKDLLEPVPVPANISGLRVNGAATSLSAQKDIRFSYGENLYEIDFIGVSHSYAEPLRYEHRLVSSNGVEWLGETRLRTVQYTSLQPGDYSFDVWAIKPDGARSEASSHLQFTVLPPWWQRWWFVGSLILVIGGILYGLHRMHLRQVLAVERIRSRIATDLHDEIGAGLTHIGLLSEVSIRKAAMQTVAEGGVVADREHNNGELQQAMSRVGDVARELSQAMSDVVWSINPKHDSVAALYRRLRSFASEICEAKEIQLNIDIADQITSMKLHPEVRRNLLLIAKEALHNMAKYSASRSVNVHMGLQENDLLLVIEDQGRGFDVNVGGDGNGLFNMSNRAEKLGGTCTVHSTPGNGTRVEARIPMGQKH